jgi:hypothetical protein
MMPDHPRTAVAAAPRQRLLASLVLLLVAASASSCRFLADEFTTYDRRAPSTLAAPDAPVSGLADRP